MESVRVLRERAGLTQQSLAKAGGTSQPTIAAYQAGSNSPTLKTLQRLASSVGLQHTVDYTATLPR
jgi:transcriptional regulator with XRE-family HTH domain